MINYLIADKFNQILSVSSYFL